MTINPDQSPINFYYQINQQSLDKIAPPDKQEIMDVAEMAFNISNYLPNISAEEAKEMFKEAKPGSSILINGTNPGEYVLLKKIDDKTTSSQKFSIANDPIDQIYEKTGIDKESLNKLA